ncbi:MAG: sigma factor-like helix-turn-helix DNA-binding protein, partial [Myxococcota bacterium]
TRDTHALPVSTLDPPSLVLNTLRRFGIATIGDVLDLDLDQLSRTRGVGCTKVDALHAMRKRAVAISHYGAGHYPEDHPSLLDELAAAGIDLDTPWEHALPTLGRRTQNVFAREEFVTLRDVVVRFESGTLRAMQGFGKSSHDTLRRALDELATHGLDHVLFGELGPPKDLFALLEHVWLHLDDDDRTMVRQRTLEGRTLEEIGAPMGLSRERVRQRIERSMRRSRRRFADSAKGLLDPVLTALRSRGLVPLDEALALARIDDIPSLLLTTQLAGKPATLVAEVFVTLRPDIEVLLDAWSESMRRIVSPSIPLETAQSAAAEHDLRLSVEDVRELAHRLWRAETTGAAIVNPWMTHAEHVCAALARLGGPSSLETIAEEVRVVCGLDHPPTERQVYSGVTRAPDIFAYDRGRYVHADHLPVALDVLRRAAAQCVDALRGETHAVSASTFLDALVHDGLLPEPIPPMLLRDVMGRDARVQLFQATDLVAHVESFRGARRTQSDWVEEVLLESPQPMTCDDVCAEMPEHITFHRDAIYASLQNHPSIINLGKGRFVHREAIGLNERSLRLATRTAASALPEDGEPVGAATLLADIDTPWAALLRAHEHGEELLWALVRAEDDVASGPGGLLAKRTRATPEGLLWECILRVLSREVLCSPMELEAALERRFGYSAGASSVYYALDRAEERGELVRVMAWRALASASADDLAHAVRTRIAVRGEVPEATTQFEQDVLRRALSHVPRGAS